MINVGNELSGATYSSCRTWRYQLWRRWNDFSMLVIIGLNPSTADEAQNDPTISRCISFAQREEYGGLLMLNLFAFRATVPKNLNVALDPIGPENDEVILSACQNRDRVIAAWGNHGELRERDRIVRHLLHSLSVQIECFGITKLGYPRHPLYLRKDTPLVKYPD